MKKLIPLIVGLSLAVGAVTAFAGPQTPEKTTKKAPKSKTTKGKSTK